MAKSIARHQRQVCSADAICSTCGKAANAPHRRIVGGRIAEGCVSMAHNGHLITPSGSAEWHAGGAGIRRSELLSGISPFIVEVAA